MISGEIKYPIFPRFQQEYYFRLITLMSYKECPILSRLVRM